MSHSVSLIRILSSRRYIHNVRRVPQALFLDRPRQCVPHSCASLAFESRKMGSAYKSWGTRLLTSNGISRKPKIGDRKQRLPQPQTLDPRLFGVLHRGRTRAGRLPRIFPLSLFDMWGYDIKHRKVRNRSVAGCNLIRIATGVAHCPKATPPRLTELKGSALADLDDVTIRIADVAARLAVLGDRFSDELRSSTFP